jgi:hypothetical protein
LEDSFPLSLVIFRLSGRLQLLWGICRICITSLTMGYSTQIEVSVDGRNPAPIDRWCILFMGFQPSKVVQDFFHPQ